MGGREREWARAWRRALAVGVSVCCCREGEGREGGWEGARVCGCGSGNGKKPLLLLPADACPAAAAAATPPSVCGGWRGLRVVIADLHEGEAARLWAAAGPCAWGPACARRGPLGSSVCIKVGVGSGALAREAEPDAGACEGLGWLLVCGGAEPGRVERKGRVVRPGRRPGVVPACGCCCCCCCCASATANISISSISASQPLWSWEEDAKS